MGIKFSKRIATPVGSDEKAASDPKAADVPEATQPGKIEQAVNEPEKLVMEVGPAATEVCLPSGNCVMEEKPAGGPDASALTSDAEVSVPVAKVLDPVVEKPADTEAEPKAPATLEIPSPCSLLDPVIVDKPSEVSAADEEKEDCEGNPTSPLEDLKQQASDITEGIVTGLEDISVAGSEAVSGLLDGEAKIPVEAPSVDLNSLTELM